MKRGGPLRRRTPLRAVGKKGRLDAAGVRAAKAELLLRSQGRCEARGFSPLCTGYGIHAHHVVRRSQGGRNEPSNLLWVCHPCHERIHACPADALVAGLLKPGSAA